MDLRTSILAPLDGAMAVAGEIETTGVALRERRFLTLINLRGDETSQAFAESVADALGTTLPTTPNTVATAGDIDALWLAPGEWLIVAADAARDDLMAKLGAATAEQHTAVTDVSAASVVLELAGIKAREVLAKGCGLDLHPRTFAPGRCAQSLIARAPALLWQLTEAPPAYLIVVRSAMARYLAAWLIDAMAEYRRTTSA
jgi:sarcosine oxidase subunit gamma